MGKRQNPEFRYFPGRWVIKIIIYRGRQRLGKKKQIRKRKNAKFFCRFTSFPPIFFQSSHFLVIHFPFIAMGEGFFRQFPHKFNFPSISFSSHSEKRKTYFEMDNKQRDTEIFLKIMFLILICLH